MALQSSPPSQYFVFEDYPGDAPSPLERWGAGLRLGYMWKYIGFGVVALWTVIYFVLNAVGTLQTARDLFQNRGEIIRVVGLVLTSQWLPLGLFLFGVAVVCFQLRPLMPPANKSARPASVTYSDMTNVELRAATEKFVARLRKFNSDFRRTDEPISTKEWQEFTEIIQKIPEEERTKPEVQKRLSVIQNEVLARKMDRYGKFQDAYQANFLIEAQLLDKELKKRVNIKALITDPGSGAILKG
jgi:hypothetical protein